ncbi:dystrophin-like isoform X1 [Acropora muricata]|uniref:dystrophin-like isoform X1 n=1 Tax=Acropora muricata TaxID=159855 RepID=UPI0034E4601E
MAALDSQSETRESAVFQKIREKTGAREEIHKKTFRKWMNTKLAKAVPPLEIKDLIEEIRDGHVLLSLLEVLIGHPLQREKGRTRVHKLSNVATALRELEKRKVKLVGISNYDIVDGKTTPILGLLWSIILRFQVQDVIENSDTDTSVKDFQVEKKLLTWCQTALEGYEDVVKLKDFTTSWRDGLAFNAIIHTHKPMLFRFESLLNNDNHTNLDHAFTVANEEFAVPKLLEPGDIDVDKPDKKLIIMYLTSLFHGLREYSPQGGKKRRKLEDLSGLDQYRAMLKGVNDYISEVENKVTSKLETIDRFADPQEEYKISQALTDDIEKHVDDVADVVGKGKEVIESGKADEIHCTEIKNETRLLHERWEKLEILLQRLHKRCRGAVVSPREQQIDTFILWIKRAGGAISTRGRNRDPEVIKKEIKEHEATLAQIELKQPEIERVAGEVKDLCRKQFLGDEDRDALQRKVGDLQMAWDELRTEAIEKETILQDRLVQSTPVEEHVQTEILAEVEQADVQLAPSEIGTLDIQSEVQDVVESKPNVHYLIDFEEDTSLDQTDSAEGKAEKDAKLAKLMDKRDAIMLVLKACSAKLDTLKSVGAPNFLQEVNEQRTIVQECDAQLEAGEPLMQDAVLYARELTLDTTLHDDEKENIAREMAQLQEHYDELRNFVEDEQEGLHDLSKELEKRQRIRYWEEERDDLNEKLDDCQDKVFLPKADRDSMITDELILESKAFFEEINSLEGEVKKVAKDGRDLIQTYNINGHVEEDITKDIDEIQERYDELKNRSIEEIKRLEDLSAKQENTAIWIQTSENVSAIIDNGREKLDDLKSSDPQSVQEIQEQLEKVQTCVDDLSSKFPEIQAGLDYGNNLLADKILNEKDIDQIEKDVDRLGIKFQNLKKNINDEQERLIALLTEAHAEEERKSEKLKKWNDWREKLNSKYKKTRGKFIKVKGQGIPREPRKVKERLEFIQECSSDIAECVPEIQEAVACATEVIESKNIDRKERDVVQKEVKEVGEGFKTLKLELNDYEKELADLISKQEKEKVEKVDRWEIWLTRIKELIVKCQGKGIELKARGEPQKKKEIDEQLTLANECKLELDSSKPVIEEGLNYGKSLLLDVVIDNDKKADVKKKVEEIEVELAEMERDNYDRQGKLEVILSQYNAAKTGKINKWESWKARITSILVQNRDLLYEVKSEDPSTDPRKTEEQLAKAKGCHDSLNNSEPEIKFAIECGEQLVEDDLTEAEEKEKIQEDVKELEKGFRDLKAESTKEKIRLEQLFVQQEDEKKQKLKRWEIWVIRIEELEKRCREKLQNPKSKGDPEDLQDQIIYAQEFQEDLESAKPQIMEGLAYGSELLNDDLIDEQSKADVKRKLDYLSEGLTTLEKTGGDEQSRLQDLLLIQEMGKRKKIVKWEELSSHMKELMENCRLKLQVLRSKGDPKVRKDVDEQMILADAFRNELESSKPTVSDGLDYGHHLLEDDDINKEMKSSVAQDIKNLEDDWAKLKDADTDEEQRLRDRVQAFDEQQNLMEDWKEKYTILKSGMDAADEKIDQGKKAEDPEEIENCYILLKDLSDGLEHMEPEVNSTLHYGRELDLNETLSNDLRLEVSEDVKYLDKRWKGLQKQTQDEYATIGVKLGAAQEKQKKLETWNKRCEELHEWVDDQYTRLRSRSSSPEVTFGGIKRQKSVIEDLVSDLQSKQREVNELIDEGNQFTDDTNLPEKDREAIHEKMVALHDDWNKLANLTSGKQQTVKVLLFEKEQQHLDKTQNWRRKIDPIMSWVASAETKLNTHFEIAPDLDTVKKQKYELEDFNNEMLSHQREVSDALVTGDKLLKDSELPEDDRNAIQKEVLDLSHRWENLEELVTWKTDRIDDTILKLKLQQEHKLEKWHKGLGDIDGWVMKTKVKVDAERSLASDVDSALEQTDDFQEIIKDAPLYQEKVTHLNEFSSNLMADPCLGEEERKLVRGETEMCNEKWNELVNLANAKQTRMEENLNKLERQERDTLERWRMRSERGGLALDKLEGQISVIDDPIGNTLETIRRQEEAFEIFSSEVDLNTSHMIDTFALGEQVRKDPKLTMKKKEEVKVHLNSLTARWERVKDFLALRRERLEESSKRLQRDRKHKLHDWEERLNSIDTFLRKAERETDKFEPIGDDLETVRRQNEDFEHSTSNLLAPQRRVDDFGKFTDELLADPVIDEKSKQSMASDRDNRVERWARVVDKTNHHRARLDEKLSNLDKSEHEVSRWQDELAVLHEEFEKAESICQQEYAPDVDTLEKQKKDAQKLKDDVEILSPQVEEFLQSSNDLLEEYELSVTEMRRIEKERESLKRRWNKLKSDANSREPRIEEEIQRLQKRQKELLEEWRNSCNTTLKWIADTSVRVQAQDIKTEDVDHARAQRQELEDITKEIMQYDKGIVKHEELGDKIVNDPSMRDLERNLVEREKVPIKGRWEQLLSNSESAKKRLDQRIRQLEEEQRHKMASWAEKTESLEAWLVQNETMVASYEPIGYDINHVRRQSEEAQLLVADLLRKQPTFGEMREFGNQLTTDPCIGLEERVRLQKQMQFLHERWNKLYASATSRHDRVQERLKILEDEERKLDEERKRIEEEEIQRRLDEERMRLEEETRKKKEEEERKRREEEARLQKELVARQKREEQERVRREDEEKRKFLELEMRRREEDEIKRREEEKRQRKEEKERVMREEEERRLKEEGERRKREEERRKKEEEEWRRREEEAGKRREEDERRRKEEEERWEREQEERKEREEEKRKQREEERKRKQEERKQKEEERQRKRKEAEEEKKKRQEEEKLKAFTFITPEPRVELTEQDPGLFSGPVVEEVILSLDEDVVEAGMVPGIFEGKLDDWKRDANDIDEWLEIQETNLPEDSDHDTIASLKDKEGQIEKLERELPAYDKRYHDLENDFGELYGERDIAEDQQEAIGARMDRITSRWNSLHKVKDAQKQRIKSKIWEEEQKKAGELASCRVNLQAVKNWIELRYKELESMDPNIGSDLDTLLRQKKDMEHFSKRISDYEPRFTEATDAAHTLCKDPAFSLEENKALQKGAEDCQNKWDEMIDKARDRMDKILRKVPKVEKSQKDILEDWKDTSARFEKSLRKTEEKLKEQINVGREIGYETWSPETRLPELTRRRDDENNTNWRPELEESNSKLKSVREKLEGILRDKKTRKWTILETLKDVVNSMTTRFRGTSRNGLSLDKVVDLLEDHEDIMTDTGAKHRDADELFALGSSALESNVLTHEQRIEIDERMSELRTRWDGLNIDVIEHEKRLEKFAQDIENEYQTFDTWRTKCDNVNQWLTESEKLIKSEERVGDTVDALKEQIEDNQLFLSEVKQYEPNVDAMFKDSQVLGDSSKLDKSDIDGVHKTKNALSTRWNAVNSHLINRQQELESALSNILKMNTEGRLTRWKEQAIALGLLITDTSRKMNDNEADDKDYGNIKSKAAQLGQVEQSLHDELSNELIEVTEAGRDIIAKQELQLDDEDGVHETINALNRQVTELERGTRESKDRIKEDSFKYFGRSLAECELGCERLEDSLANFSDIGSDISEVGKQLIQLKEFEGELVKEQAKFSDIKDQFEDGKETEILRAEDQVRVSRRISALDEKWAELDRVHDENCRRLTQAMIVLHEELMEEIYEWLNDAEKQADSIAVNNDDIAAVKDEYGRHRELKEEITSFEPTFRNAISISDRLLNEKLVDPERADSYEKEIDILENRWENLQTKTVNNSRKLAGVLGRYVTTRLDEAEVAITRAHSSIGEDDGEYLDLQSAKRAVDAFQVKKKGVRDCQRKVDEILVDSDNIIGEDFFRENERDLYQGKSNLMKEKNKELGEKVVNEETRLHDTYILLLKQNLQRMNVWLNMAESRTKLQEEIGPEYDDVRKQLEDHQKFQEELRDHSMISMVLDVDVDHPTVNERTQKQVKSLSDRWSKVWNWSEQRKAQLLKVLSNWQRFRDEQLILLNWLSSKEKALKDMGRTDLADEDEVTIQLEKLRLIEKELDEQGMRLQSLHKAGEDLQKNVDQSDPAALEITKQLKDFDDCWNDIAKEVINRVQQMETSKSRLKEFRTAIDATNEWMDETEKLLKSFNVGMDPEEASKLQEKAEIKCEERPRYAAKVDRINRLGEDLAGDVDQPSHDAIQEELEPFNARWNDVFSQLDNFSDKGYPQGNNECCFIRVMKSKFGGFQ